jgi:thioredoxin-like negative regulator of GroEL
MNRKHTTRKFTQVVEILPINDAVQIKAAEYWLKLGDADQALEELEALPHDAWNHPSAVKARVAAVGALRESIEFAMQQ